MQNRLMFIVRQYNFWVIAGIILVSMVLGVLNNLRVYEEQRVKWFGGPVISADDDLEDSK